MEKREKLKQLKNKASYYWGSQKKRLRKFTVFSNVILWKYKYSNIRDLAWHFLLTNHVQFYPLDIEQIINSNGWLLCNSESNYGKALCNYFNVTVTDALTLTGDNYNYIIFNPINNVQRIRFSLAHEIGHIVLQHNLRKIQDKEKEANMFAARILMPMTLIRENGIRTPEELAKICNVSISAATHRMVRYNILERRNKFYLSPLERKLKLNIKPNESRE